jgi:hypothetical protein
MFRLPAGLSEAELPAAREELRGLLEGKIVTESSSVRVQVVTSMEPPEVDKALRRFSAKHGIIDFRGGSKLA